VFAADGVNGGGNEDQTFKCLVAVIALEFVDRHFCSFCNFLMIQENDGVRILLKSFFLGKKYNLSFLDFVKEIGEGFTLSPVRAAASPAGIE